MLLPKYQEALAIIEERNDDCTGMDNVKVLLKERKQIANPNVDQSYEKPIAAADANKPLFRPQVNDFMPKSEDILAKKRNMLIKDSDSAVVKQVERLASLQRNIASQQSQNSETESQKALKLPLLSKPTRHLVNQSCDNLSH